MLLPIARPLAPSQIHHQQQAWEYHRKEFILNADREKAVRSRARIVLPRCRGRSTGSCEVDEVEKIGGCGDNVFGGGCLDYAMLSKEKREGRGFSDEEERERGREKDAPYLPKSRQRSPLAANLSP